MHITVTRVKGVQYCYAAECIWSSGDKKYIKPSKAVGKIDTEKGFLPNKYFSNLLKRRDNDPEGISAYEQRVINTVKAKYGDDLKPGVFPKSYVSAISGLVKTASLIHHGPQLVFESITRKYQIDTKLTASFGKELAQDILSLAWYITSEGNALSNNDSWLDYFENPKGRGLSSQEVSRLLDLISYDGMMTFYKLWLKSFSVDHDKVLYDLTSISYYGSGINSAEWGNKWDRDNLPQVNYAFLCLRSTGMPLFAWPLSGGITDVITLQNTLQLLNNLGYKPSCLMLDRGFASQGNIGFMLSNGYTFLQALRVNAKWIYEIIDTGERERNRPDSILEIENRTYYVSTAHLWWVRCIKRKGKKVKEDSFFWQGESKDQPYTAQEGEDVEILEQHQCQAHVLFSHDLVGNSRDRFMKKLNSEYKRLLGNPASAVKSEYAPYFIISKPKYARKRTVDFNMEPIEKHKNKYAGYICFLTNDPTIKTAENALQEYSTRDYIEKDFDEMKNELDMERIRVHKDNRMRSRLFIQFIAEIFLREIRVQLDKSEACRKMTKTQIFNHIKAISKVQFEGAHEEITMHLSKNQRNILQALGIQA
jgi:hypothetical protein